jgi:hypothetical protein
VKATFTALEAVKVAFTAIDESNQGGIDHRSSSLGATICWRVAELRNEQRVEATFSGMNRGSIRP